MKYRVELVKVGHESWVRTFDTHKDAMNAEALLLQCLPLGYRVLVSRIVPPLLGWLPDAGDMMVLNDLMVRRDDRGVRTGNVLGIKFARCKAGCGLKEAKDWCDENFGTK